MMKTVKRKRLAHNVWESIAPLRRWSKLFALWCFDRDHYGSYPRSFRHKVVTATFLTLYALLFLAWLPNRSSTWGAVKDSMIISYLMNMYATILPITAFYSLTIVHIIAPVKIKILTEIEEVDARLIAVGCLNAMPAIGSYVKKFCVVVIVCGSTSVGLGLLLSTANLLQLADADVKLWLQMLIFCISYVLHLLIVVQYLVWCAVLQKRFELLKYILQKIAAKSFAVTKYPDDDAKFIAVIREVAVHYYRLTRVVREAAKAYSFSLFMQIVSYFAMFLCQGYVLVYLLIIAKDMNFNALSGAVYYSCAVCFELIGIVYVTETLCYQVNQILAKSPISNFNCATSRSFLIVFLCIKTK